MNADAGWVRTHPAYRAVVERWPVLPILACSGGVDSSALLVLAGLAVQRDEIDPFVVIHVDHQTRLESADEGAIVSALASRFGLTTVRVTVDPADASATGLSPEERWRTLRYLALARVASQRGVSNVVTAHTRDDQVETVLMRLLSGSGGLAASGMAHSTAMETAAGTITIHRPLLDVRRADLVDVLQRTGVDPIVDPSNEDRSYRRNALRLDIIPALQGSFPGYEAALLRSVELAARDAAAVDECVMSLASTLISTSNHTVRVDRAALRALQPALSTRVIRSAAGALMPANRRELSFERIEAVREAAAGRTGASIELPYGVIVAIERTEIVFERKDATVAN